MINTLAAITTTDITPQSPQHWSALLADRLLAMHPDTSETIRQSLKQAMTQLSTALDEGHTCLDVSDWDAVTCAHPLIVVDTMAQERPAPLVLEQGQLFFYRHWQQETLLVTKLQRLLQQPQTIDVDLSLIQDANALQQAAIILAAQSNFTLITGGPGTGKTFTLVRIVKALQHAAPNLRIALAAPTGKAAQRMQSVLQQAFDHAGIAAGQIQVAQTVHRLLGLGGTGQAKFHAQQPLPFDLIVIDEGSMLDLALASQLLCAIKTGTRLIILGDADQLAAVDAGAVLADLSRSPALAAQRIHLSESRRFDAQQGIGQLAHLVLTQQTADLTAALHNAQVQHLAIDHLSTPAIYDGLWQPYHAYVAALQRYTADSSSANNAVDLLFNAFDTYRILCASKHGLYGTRRVNFALATRLQQAMSATPNQINLNQAQNLWYQGRPVMMTRNDYGLGLSNGDIGLCLWSEMDSGKRGWMVHFPSKAPISVARLPQHQLETAFAITIHKSQGSEFERVAMLLEEAHATDDTTASLNTRELVYTAITRAKQQVDIWARETALRQAINTKTVRHSGLGVKLNHALVHHSPSTT